MKLTGSKTEQRYRQELKYSTRYLKNSEAGKNVVMYLNGLLGEFKTAYVLTHTPEQGEDVFRILVDAEKVIGFEMLHGRPPRKIEGLIKYDLKEYEKLVGNKEARLKLAIALELSKKELNSSKG